MPSFYLLRHSERSLESAAAALSAEPDWQCLGRAQRVKEASQALHGRWPEFLVCDLRLVDGHASRLLRQLQQLPPGLASPRVLVLSQAADDLTLFDAMRYGAHAYHVEAPKSEPLTLSLQALQHGRARMSPAIARQTLESFGLGRCALPQACARSAAQDKLPVAPLSLLSRAEHALLSLLSQGLLLAEIAQHWALLVEELERRVARLYRKLHAWQQRDPALQAAVA